MGSKKSDSIFDLLTPVDGGFRVKETDRYYLDVMQMLFNWRLCCTRKDCELVYDRSWCYVGRDQLAFLTAVFAALEWDGSDDTEPVGWNKNNQTGEWREWG